MKKISRRNFLTNIAIGTAAALAIPETLFEAGPSPVVALGQKTLAASQDALSRVNVRKVLLQVQKIVEEAVEPYMFHPADDITFGRIRDGIIPGMEALKSRRAIWDFGIQLPGQFLGNDDSVKVIVKPIHSSELGVVIARVV